jgi:uroporphyrinogen-III synthase
MNGFGGLRVLALESRRGVEIGKLIATYGGVPTLAPSMREVPLKSNQEALDFLARFLKGDFQMMIFLTGVGSRALLALVETAYPREQYVAALQHVKVVARGPKPVAALRELGITPSITVPEPNTWRELLGALDAAENVTGENGKGKLSLRGMRVAVQEYGVSNPELLAGLEQRGAHVTRVPIYQWALPEDVGPLRTAVDTLVQGEMDVVLFTTSVQATHLFQMATEMKVEEPMRQSLNRMVVASIGPTTAEELLRLGVPADFQPSHPKMGVLVKETAEQAAELLRRKRA